MSKGTRDGLILAFIALILYGLLYYNFYLNGALVQFKDIQSKIDTAEQKKAALDEDVKNLPTLQRNLDIKNVQNERLEEYLMSEANLSDNIDYIDKLAKLFKNSFTGIKVNVPTENTSKSTSTKYYEFAIDVDANMAYEDAMNLVDYVEGGSRKVKITQFNLTPKSVTTAAQNPNVNTSTSTLGQTNFAVKMQISVYALNLSNIDKVYEYSRKRFNTFDDGDGVIFVPNSTTVGANTGSGSGVGSASQPTKVTQTVAEGIDIDISLASFLYAGQNFVIKGVGNDYPLKMKYKNRASVKITFNGNNYHVSAIDPTGKSYGLSGKTKNDVINMYVVANFPVNIKENQNLGADIQIINNSNKRVDLNLEDKVKRIKITDRNGNVIINRNEAEKVYII